MNNPNSFWSVKGHIASIVKKNTVYSVTIAQNLYKYNNSAGKYIKTDTIWFYTISLFKPLVKVGDKVLASGHYIPSKTRQYPNTMVVDSMGCIEKGEDPKDE